MQFRRTSYNGVQASVHCHQSCFWLSLPSALASTSTVVVQFLLPSSAASKLENTAGGILSLRFRTVFEWSTAISEDLQDTRPRGRKVGSILSGCTPKLVTLCPSNRMEHLKKILRTSGCRARRSIPLCGATTLDPSDLTPIIISYVSRD